MAHHQYIFEDGPLSVRLISVQARRPAPPRPTYGKNRVAIDAARISAAACLPPKPLIIALPEEAGEYPVVIMYHGYVLLNLHYSQLLKHVASHGFIVIAPQMYIVACADASQEIADAAAIIEWLPDGLTQVFPDGLTYVHPRFDKLALVGHSRGAKVAFGLALGLSESPLKICAIAGLDPVDGKDIGQQTPPAILNFSDHSLGLNLPILIVGSGLGSLKRNALFPPCAPDGVSHKAFFSDSSAPAFYFVASEHGHMDFLDDCTNGLRGKLSYCVCRNGPSRAPMRRFAGGILVAFFQAAMFSEAGSLQDLLVNPSHSPVKLEAPNWYLASLSSPPQIPDLSTVFT